MKSSDVITLCTALVALSGAISEPVLDTLTHGHGPYASTILVTLGIVAGIVIRVLSNPQGAPATAIVADAPVVAPTTGTQVGTNVSTSSTLPIAASTTQTGNLA